MDYLQSLDYLYKNLPMYQRTGGAAYKANLDNTHALDRLTGHPHRHFPSVHIAGTNGKGSVSHMLTSILKECGLRTGLYTSPHLVDFRERIRVNGEMIDQEYVAGFVSGIEPAIRKIQPSFFELTVAMAFSCFREMKVDIAVIETGMGGRLDSTNIITPEVSVITNISLDHTMFLGPDIPSIAKEKAGIIKKGIPVIVGNADAGAMEVFRSAGGIQGSPVHASTDRYMFLYQTFTTAGTSLFHYRDKSDGRTVVLECDLNGTYQWENILTVLLTIEQLGERGFRCSEKAISDGLKNTTLNTGIRGRWETLGTNPRVLCDTAHNEAGVRAVMEQLTALPSKKLHIVWGMVNDKPADTILAMLPKDARYYFTRADIPRAMDPHELVETATRMGLESELHNSVPAAMECARSKAGEKDTVFIGGSTFVVADALKSVP